MEEINAITKEQQIKAAYALNLCTVSISQIIDYNDINVLEQEYQTILNNLNLEQIPKDEALLNILKQILDTVTFFRIQEGDKKMIEKEYEYQMKNAIWASVPNLTVINTTSNLKAMAVNLALQVGIGYMNYRNNKSKYNLQREKSYWELQKSAIEQFNGLRRELFDTAWKLADRYKFPDEYRLTEKQIEQYNNILMDEDLLRRYERLSTIQDKFKAYPDFWYQMGSTASHIYIDDRFANDLELRSKFKYYAVNCFEKYKDLNVYNVLREDIMTSSWALEYIDLLDSKTDVDKIRDLIGIAIKFCGNSYDVLQICAFDYLKICEYENAKQIFRILVNEDYNKIVNAQILSKLYVSDAINNRNKNARIDYRLLASRINPEYLFPMPSLGNNMNEAQKEFIENQKDIISKELYNTLNVFIKINYVNFNKIIPPMGKITNMNNYYDCTPIAQSNRYSLAEKAFKNENNIITFSKLLVDNRYKFEVLNHLNRFIDNLDKLEMFKRSPNREFYILKVEDKILENRLELNKIQKKIEDDNELLTYKDYLLLQNELSFKNFVGDMIDELLSDLTIKINKQEQIDILNQIEYDIIHFCYKMDLPNPIILYKDDSNDNLYDIVDDRYFPYTLLGNNTEYSDSEIKRISIRMYECISSYSKYITVKGKNNMILDRVAIKAYLSNPSLNGYISQNRVVAILDDMTKKDLDLIFTIDGIIRVKKNKIMQLVNYDMIKYNKRLSYLSFNWPDRYTNKDINIEKLGKIIEMLKQKKRT